MASDLPETLASYAYKLPSRGSVEKISPFSEVLVEHGRHKKIAPDQVKLTTVAICEFDLPVL